MKPINKGATWNHTHKHIQAGIDNVFWDLTYYKNSPGFKSCSTCFGCLVNSIFVIYLVDNCMTNFTSVVWDAHFFWLFWKGKTDLFNNFRWNRLFFSKSGHPGRAMLYIWVFNQKNPDNLTCLSRNFPLLKWRLKNEVQHTVVHGQLKLSNTKFT